MRDSEEHLEDEDGDGVKDLYRRRAQESLAFLQKFRPEGPWHVQAIQPDVRNHFVGQTFQIGDEEALENWIRHYAKGCNVYFSVNPCISEPERGKPKREDVWRVEWLHVDLDPRPGEDLKKERKRLLELVTTKLPPGVPPPTLIIDSGGGYWALWRLREPLIVNGDLEKAEDAALYNKRLEEVFGADACHNIDRIARLPFTMNRPDAKKRDRGRISRRSEVIAFNDLEHSIHDFERADPTTGARSAAPKIVRRLSDIDELDKLSDSVRQTIVDGRDPTDPDRKKSRSEWLFMVCCEMVRAGYPDDTIYSVITDPEFAISESVLERRDRDRYAARQVERARSKAEEIPKNEKGRADPSLANIRRALAKTGVSLSYNEFSDRSLIEGLPGFGPYLDDPAARRLWLIMEERFGIHVGKDRFWEIVEDEAWHNRFHPVREYLAGVEWDGEPRIESFLIDYLGCPDTAYVREISRIVLIAAVRRIREPGCKFDEMLVLEGGQGLGKSTALAALAVKDEWFTDDLPLSADTKKFLEATLGRWIVEIAELNGMRKSEVEVVKSTLSRQTDRSRMAFGRLVTERARQFIMVGTTNAEQYLKDATGNRRFWPVRTGEIDVKGIARDRDQLWAEAAHREAKGESIRLPPRFYKDARIEQEGRKVEDPFVEILDDVLGDHEGRISVADVWDVVGVPPGQRRQDHNVRIGQAMKDLGWERARRRLGGRLQYVYERGEVQETLIAYQNGDGQIHVRVRDDKEAPF